MKTIVVIQARMGSSRLPGKILSPIASQKPLLAVLAERLRQPRLLSLVSDWWLATTEHPDDDITATWGDSLGLRVLRGDVDNVLSRFTAILDQEPADWVVRVMADDPFMDGEHIANMVEHAHHGPAHIDLLCDNLGDRFFPLGYMPYVVRGRALHDAEQRIPTTEPWHRSHVTSWVMEHGHTHHFKLTDPNLARPQWRWTIDTPADLHMAQRAFQLLGDAWPSTSYRGLISALDVRPDITSHNIDVREKSINEG